MDYYEFLGVSPDATQAELKAAYRRRSHECHPDTGGSGDAMKKLNQVWETLRDPLQRAAYDREILSSSQRQAKEKQSASSITIEALDACNHTQAISLFTRLFSAVGYRVSIAASHGQDGVDLVVQRGNIPTMRVKIYILPDGSLVDTREVLRCAIAAEAATGGVPWILTNREFSSGALATAKELNVLLTGRGELIATLDRVFGYNQPSTDPGPQEASGVPSSGRASKLRIHWSWAAVGIILLVQAATFAFESNRRGIPQTSRQSVNSAQSSPQASAASNTNSSNSVPKSDTTRSMPETRVAPSVQSPATNKTPTPEGAGKAPTSTPDLKTSKQGAPSNGDPQTPNPKATPSMLTLGSSREAVHQIMGTPSSMIGDTWRYGSSFVYFNSSGTVRGWSNIGGNLLIHLGDRVDGAAPITLGSSKDKVLIAMGTPSGIQGDTWQYGYSFVYFNSSGTVRGWSNIGGNLLIHLGDRDPSAPGITNGSTQQEVIRTMGTPSGIQGDTWQYGYSFVYFNGSGLVRDWANIGNNLRLK